MSFRFLLAGSVTFSSASEFKVSVEAGEGLAWAAGMAGEVLGTFSPVTDGGARVAEELSVTCSAGTGADAVAGTEAGAGAGAGTKAGPRTGSAVGLGVILTAGAGTKALAAATCSDRVGPPWGTGRGRRAGLLLYGLAAIGGRFLRIDTISTWAE